MLFGVGCDKGMVRELNEDSYNIISSYPGVPTTFIIADGMGGHNSGEIASKMAVDLAGKYIIEKLKDIPKDKDINPIIDEIITRVNGEVYYMSNQQESTYGMGTTIIIAVVHYNKLYIGHVGDSRVYLVRGNHIQRITTDHSFIEELVQNGSLSREEAEKHPQRNLITRALGCNDSVQADLYTCEINEHDYFMLCTDGLTNMLGENEIKEIVLNVKDPVSICNELVNKANQNGGTDNITVIIYSVN